jgi:hypothetical protein
MTIIVHHPKTKMRMYRCPSLFDATNRVKKSVAYDRFQFASTVVRETICRSFYSP